jgi:TATA-box binding protein (TBP) (component of TFIID and TFIIIB)
MNDPQENDLELLEELDDIVTEPVNRYPTKGDMKVATRTLICKISTNINIEKLIEKVKLESGKIEKVKFGNKKDVEEKKAVPEEKKLARKNKKTKKHFYNQVTIIIKPFPERVNGINMKLSENGSIQMTGPKTVEEGHLTIQKMIEYVYEYDNQIFYKKTKIIPADDVTICTSDTDDTNITQEKVEYDIEHYTKEELKNITILSSNCELIIVSFQLPFLIHLNKFNTILKEKYSLLSIFGTSSYPGINTKITYNYDCKESEHIKKKKRYLCKCRDMSIFTFRTGKVIITGFENIEKIETIFEQYVDIVRKEEMNIKIEPSKLNVDLDHKKKGKLLEVNGHLFEVVDAF